jgi:hypothetical protein
MMVGKLGMRIGILIGELRKEEQVNVSKSEGKRCLEYFWMAVAQVQPQKYFK